MLAEGTARLRVAVICLCVAANASLVSLGASLFRINGAFVDNLVFMAAHNSTSWNNLLLIMAIAGAAGATIGLIVIHHARRTGWPILLLVGTVLTAVHLVPVVGLPETLRDNGSEVVFAAIGAGAVLALLGLLGAANWLIHTGAPGSGCMIAGLAMVAPVLGTVVLSVLPIAEADDLAILKPLGLVLCGIGTAGAIGATALIPMLRRHPEPEPPRPMVTVMGGVAAAIAVLPMLVVRIYGGPLSPENFDPADPNALETVYDDLSLLLGMTGLVIFVAGIGIAAALGSTSLGAAIAVGLVLYAVQIPLWVAMRSVDSQAGLAVLAALGLVLACLAAVSRWRAWVAGGACALVGVVIVVTRPPFLGGRMSAFLGACLLVLVVLAVVTTVAAGAAAAAERTRVPAVLGAVAVMIQLSLVYAGAVVSHSEITGDRTEPGFEPAAVDTLTIASGIALLIGALLVVVLPLIRTLATPAPEQPEVPPPDQAVPVAR